MSEEWRDVVGYVGRYQISSHGRVKSFRCNKGHKVRILKPGIHQGYHIVCLSDQDRREHTRRVHSLVLEAFHGPRPSGYESGHLDGIRTHNNRDNLRWITHQENVNHRLLHGTERFGSRNNQAKLNERNVIKIRSLCQRGLTQDKIASQFGVKRQTISDVLRRKNWGHVKEKA